MEIGFYHPSVGYWQTTDDPDDSTKDTYPSGSVEVPLKPSADHVLVNGVWVYTTPVVSVPHVVSKLQAELAAGQAVVSLVETFMQQPDTPWAMKRGWFSANELYRNSQMVDELAYVLGWTSDQVDALFIAAEKVTA